MKKVNVSIDQLNKIATKLFLGMGCNEEEATYAADVLVETDRRGVDTHGVARLGLYRYYLDSGRAKRNAKLKTISSDAPYLMLDADNGVGIIMAPQAVDLAIRKAEEWGCCIMGVRNSNHFGAAGYYAAKCADRGFVAIVSSNSPPTMAPFGGKVALHGNSPWSMAMPGGLRHTAPVMFDMACSEVSRGKLETAQREGMQAPQGWGIDGEGMPSADPAEILKNGTLLPFGGIKGYCITMLVEVLSSLLTFASYGKGLNMVDSMNTGHFALLLDPSRFGDFSAYCASIDDYVDSIKGSPRAPGVGEIIIPGELEARAIRHHDEFGLDLDEGVAASLAEIAVKIGLLTAEQGFEDMLEW